MAKLKEKEIADLKLNLISNHEKDGRTYNMPTVFEVATLIIGDVGIISRRYIIVQKQDGDLQPIDELHVCYLALEYPLFPYREDRYKDDVLHNNSKNKKKKEIISQLENGSPLNGNLRTMKCKLCCTLDNYSNNFWLMDIVWLNLKDCCSSKITNQN